MNPDSCAKARTLMTRVLSEIQTWVRIVFFTVIRFYRINLQKAQNQYWDVRQDLLLNMITSLIMRD